MPNQQNTDVDYLVDDDGEPLAGDALVKRLRKMVRELSKDKNTLETELTTYRGQAREATLAEKLSAHGIPAKAAKWVPEDADVDEWIKENAEMFGGSTEPVKADDKTAETGTATGSAEDPEAARLAALRNTASTPATGGFTGIPDSAKASPEALAEFLKAAVAGLQ